MDGVSHPGAEVEAALDAVSQMFAQVKSEPTPAEAMLWAEEIERLGPQAVLRFARFWMAGGGQNGFMRAPRIVDLRRFVDPTWADEALALSRLQRLVQEAGPYRVPCAEDGMDEALAAAVQHLGGWVRVCEIMPDASDEHGLRQFERKFALAWQQVEGARVQARRLGSVQLQALGRSREAASPTEEASNSAPAPR